MTVFVSQLERLWQQGKFVCVGLDVDYERLPEVVKRAEAGVGASPRVRPPTRIEEAFFIFNREIIDATHDLVCAYKPNSAFYEAQGAAGIRALLRSVQYCKQTYPEIPVILDAKRADIGSTNAGYVASAFDLLGVDAITVHPYLGKEALAPFLERKDKGIIVLAKTSNPGSAEFQNILVGEAREPLYLVVARQVAQNWNTYGNCALVVGATYPEELKRVRECVGDMPILIPGIGAQGGDMKATVLAGRDSRGQGMIISSSRGVIYASSGQDFAQAAREATAELKAEIISHLASSL